MKKITPEDKQKKEKRRQGRRMIRWRKGINKEKLILENYKFHYFQKQQQKNEETYQFNS